MTLTAAGVVFFMAMNMIAYYLGVDEGVDQERRRNARRRAHRHNNPIE